MMNNEQREFWNVISRYCDGGVPDPVDFVQLMTLAGSYKNFQIVSCNIGLSHRQRDLELSIEKKITKLVSQMLTVIPLGRPRRQGFKVNFSGDARGYTVKIALPGGECNTLGGWSEGWGVPQP